MSQPALIYVLRTQGKNEVVRCCVGTHGSSNLSSSGQPTARDVGQEAVPHVVPLMALDCRVDVVHPDDLDVGDDNLLPSEVEHRLALDDGVAAAPGHALPAGDDGQRRQLERPLGMPTTTICPLGFTSSSSGATGWSADTVSMTPSMVPAAAIASARRRAVAADQERVGAKVVERHLALAGGHADDG
jgi:hypothetical protein